MDGGLTLCSCHSSASFTFPSPNPPLDFSSRSPESESRVMRYIFWDPENDLLHPPAFLPYIHPYRLPSHFCISAPFLPPPPHPHWIGCPPFPLPLRLFAPLCCRFLIRHCGGCYTWRKHVCADASFMLMGDAKNSSWAQTGADAPKRQGSRLNIFYFIFFAGEDFFVVVVVVFFPPDVLEPKHKHSRCTPSDPGSY